MEWLQFITHYSFHLLFPGIAAYIFFRSNWKKIYLIWLLTMLVDLDHLWSSPVMDSCRCSIAFHPLHSYPAIIVYILLLIWPRTRIVAIGLVWHMMTDGVDCLFSAYNCQVYDLCPLCYF